MGSRLRGCIGVIKENVRENSGMMIGGKRRRKVVVVSKSSKTERTN